MGHFHCCSTCFVLYNFFSLIMATNFFFFNQGLILLSYSRLYSVESCFFSYDLLLFQFHVYQCVCFTLRNINVLHRNWVCWAELNALMFFPNILNYFLLKLSFLLSLYCRAASLFFYLSYSTSSLFREFRLNHFLKYEAEFHCNLFQIIINKKKQTSYLKQEKLQKQYKYLWENAYRLLPLNLNIWKTKSKQQYLIHSSLSLFTLWGNCMIFQCLISMQAVILHSFWPLSHKLLWYCFIF